MQVEKLQKAADVVRFAGGRVVGRTRLQKVAYLLQAAGFDDSFPFEYRHYGPYSEDLARSIEFAGVMDLVSEEERKTDWGGFYSVYEYVGDEESVDKKSQASKVQTALKRFAETAAKGSAVALELAATAAYLSEREGIKNPWDETARRKPDKANQENLQKAQKLYNALKQIESPNALPDI